MTPKHTVAVFTFTLTLLLSATATAATTVVSIDSPYLASTAANVDDGGKLRVEGLSLGAVKG